ncbi:NAD-binding protein [Pseudonocardia sp. GCM10023141]|uniref:NAD-binding protein n=1 Tax=Pseudonocardia sp. GCM10023141 TaxID=3252653 RepID=UPI003617E9A2
MEIPETGHVVVCGVDGVALRTVEQLLAAGAEVVVVDPAQGADVVAERLLAQWKVRRVEGRLRESLLDAGLATAVAVVCLLGDDLRAMETALLARRLRPDVRLVVQMGNGSVGRALAEVTGEGGVFDVAALSAPAVVEACLGTRTHTIELAGSALLVAEVVAQVGAGRTATLRELYAHLAPLAVASAGEAPLICPGRDHAVRAGDRVTLVGTPEQFQELATPEVVELMRPQHLVRQTAGARSAGVARAIERAETGRSRPGLRALARSLVTEADGRLRATLAVLAVAILVSIVVLQLGYTKADGSRMSVVDAVYFTVETIATVGYGDFSFAEQQTWLRIWAIGLMGGGAILTAIIFSLITQLLVSSRLEQSFGRRRVGSTRGHVIVVGLGSVALEVVQELVAAGRRVVVIDREEAGRHHGHARALDVPVVVGDATDAAVLTAANLHEAIAVAVLTSDDLVNVETGLVVRDQLGDRWDQVPVVLRVFDRELATGIEDGFGFRYVRSTAALAAPWFVGAALGLDVLATFYVDRIPFLVGRLAVAAGGGLDGLAMAELSERTRVVSIRRAARDGERQVELLPRRGTRFGAGDDAYLIGPYEELMQVLRRDAPRAPAG